MSVPVKRRLRLIATAVAVTLLLAGCGADHSATSTATTVASLGQLVSIGAGLSGPAGTTATVYAQGPTKMSAFTQDSSGRLWIATADSTDSGQDGVYVVTAAGATATLVIANLHTALGLVWIGDTLYVASKELVEAYSGFDGTAFASHHTVLTLPSGVGESNNLAVSPDGRLLLGISSPSDNTAPTLAYSASIVSFQRDGSDLQVYASGIRAAVGLTYYPRTSNLFVTMNQRDDLADATPGDWLAQVRQGENWKFPDCYGQGGTVCDGVPSPVAVLDQHAAVSGVAILTGSLSSTSGPSAYVAEWANSAVKRVGLTDGASTTSSTAQTFITGLKNPVPLLATTTGTLLVGDWTTGTIYEIS